MPRDQSWILFFAAEAATRLHLHDTNLVGRDAEERRQRVVDVIRAL